LIYKEIDDRFDESDIEDSLDAAKMQKLLDALENLDDVQEVYTNAIINE
jgi:transcriptional/translational regulatory protein YebC/TACO1